MLGARVRKINKIETPGNVLSRWGNGEAIQYLQLWRRGVCDLGSRKHPQAGYLHQLVREGGGEQRRGGEGGGRGS